MLIKQEVVTYKYGRGWIDMMREFEIERQFDIKIKDKLWNSKTSFRLWSKGAFS